MEKHYLAFANFPARTNSEDVRGHQFARAGKFVLAGRQNQRARCACYPEFRVRAKAYLCARRTMRNDAANVSESRAPVSTRAFSPAATTRPSRSSSAWEKTGMISST